jgi:iron-sulfur cluster repair protein YtfE (RIC family)
MITRPLREEHKELLPYIEQLKGLADGIGSAGTETIRRGLAEAERFLRGHLIPHAQTEDRVLYPEVQRVMGSAKATGTMSRDHEEVGKLAGELSALRERLPEGNLSGQQEVELRRVLYGLYALVKLHFAKEEEIYLPLLDVALSETEAQALLADMEQTAARLKET